ncbi:MAG: M48 family metallopeptidase [Candidatus Helarchaeota archaeon]
MKESKALLRINGKLAFAILATVALTFFAGFGMVALASWFMFATIDFLLASIIGLVYAGIQTLFQLILTPWSIQSHFGSKLKFITREDNPKVWDMVQEMSNEAKIKFSKVGILNTSEINAFVYWGLGYGNAIVFTKGILNVLDEEELKGVCGHEIGHVRFGDVKAMIFLASIPIFLHTFYYYSQSKESYEKDSLIWLLIFLIFFAALIASSFLSLYISRMREYRADANSTQMMKSPIPIAAALAKITYKNVGKVKKTLATRKELHMLCIVDPNSVARQTKQISEKVKSIAEIADQIDDPDIDPDVLEKEMEKEKLKGGELERTHPLTVNRITFVVEYSKELGLI